MTASYTSSVAVAVSGDSAPLLAGDGVDLEDPRVITHNKKGSVRKWVTEFFLVMKNPNYASDAELAFRGAFFMTLFGIPIIMPHGVWPLRDYLVDTGLYSSSVCTYIIYNLGRTFGEAFDNVKSGLRGSIIAAVMGWILYGLCPDGYNADMPDSVWWIGVASGTVYVLIIAGLRLGINLQIWAISNFAGTWMTFLDASKSANVIPPWRPGWTIADDCLAQGLFVTGIGFITIMITSLLPYPMWSLVVVQEKQAELNREVPRIFRLIVDYYSDDSPNVYVKDQVVRNIRRIKSVNSNIKPLIQASYWECYGLGRSQVKREILSFMDTSCDRIYDLLYNAWTAAGAEEAATLDAELMRELKPQTSKALVALEVVLNLMVKAADDGALTDAEKAAVKKACETMEQEEEALGAIFDEAREKVTKSDAKAKYKDVRVAQVLYWSLSSILNEASVLANHVIESAHPSGKSTLPKVVEFGSVLEVFQNLSDKEHIIFAVRASLSFFVCFWIGYYGFRDAIPAKNASIASTAAILLSKYVGSAVVKDLNRIQGLMIGNVMARILVSFTTSCMWHELTLHMMITFLWVFTGLYINYHSVRYATIGSLSAAFGASTLLSLSCTDPTLSKTSTYDGLTTACTAVLITAIIDMIVSTDRAADKAYKALDECWGVLGNSINAMLDSSVSKVEVRVEKAKGLLATAQALGVEADLEPRGWRTEWRTDIFGAVCKDTEHLIVAIASIETAIASSRGDGCVKHEMIRQMTVKSSLFNETLVTRKMAAVRKLLSFFVHETAERFPMLGDKEATYEFRKDEEKAEQMFLAKEVDALFGKRGGKVKKLTEDQISHIAVVLAGLSRVKEVLRSVQHTILQNTWQA